MKPQPDIRTKMQRWLFGLGIFVLFVAMMLFPLVLGLHLTGELLLPAWLLYGISFPMCVLFMVCLIKFPWGTKIIMVVFVGVMFILSSEMVISIRNNQRQRAAEHSREAAAP